MLSFWCQRLHEQFVCETFIVLVQPLKNYSNTTSVLLLLAVIPQR